MTSTDPVTIGELSRRIDRFESSVADGFKQLSREVAATNSVHVDRYEADQRAAELRLAALEDRIRWVSRATGSMLLTIVAAVVIAFINSRGGP